MCILKDEIERAELEVKQALQDALDGKNNRNIFQLKCIAEELARMKNDACANVSYTRMIIDSWDFSDLLGVELLKLAEKYKIYMDNKRSSSNGSGDD